MLKEKKVSGRKNLPRVLRLWFAGQKAELERRQGQIYKDGADGLETFMQRAVHASCRQHEHGHSFPSMVVLTAEPTVWL